MSTKPETQVVRKQEVASYLATTFRTHDPTISPRLNEIHNSVTVEGEPAYDATSEGERRVRLLEDASEKLTAAGRGRLDALADRKAAYARERQEARVASSAISSVKSRLRPLVEKEILALLGLDKNIAQGTSKLIEQAEHLATKMTTVDVITTRLQQTGLFNPAQEAQKLRNVASELGTAQDAVVQAKKTAMDAQQAKKDAMKELNRLNVYVARYLVAEYRLAGFDALADEVHLRRPRSSPSPSEDPPSDTTGGDTTTGGDSTGGDTTGGDTTGGALEGVTAEAEKLPPSILT